MTLEEAIAIAKETGDYQVVVDAIPYHRFIGLQLTVTPDGPLTRIGADKKLIGNPVLPALHGGVVGAFLESTAIIHLIWAQETVQMPKTIDFSVDYLRSARPVETFARGVLTKHGRRVANVRVEAWQDDRDRPVATAHGNFLLA